MIHPNKNVRNNM
jgi:hypothetical protein